jgi:flagellar motor protein MotB
MPGCLVTQHRYDDALSKLQQQTVARDGAERRAQVLQETLTALEAELHARELAAEAAKDALNAELLQLRFDADVVATEREEARAISEQLRAELERVGNDLRSFASDKTLLGEERDRLSAQLQAAELRLQALSADEAAAELRFKAARELTLALAKPLKEQRLKLTLVDGDIALQFSRSAVFEENSAALSGAGQGLLKQAAKALQPLELTVHVQQPASATEPKRAERARAVSEQLVKAGLPSERVQVVASTGTPSAAATTVPEASTDEESVEAPAPKETALAEPVPSSAAEGADGADAELELRLHVGA